MKRLWLMGAVAALCCAPAWAQAVATSAAPDSVEVTIYRDNSRSPGDAIDRDWPQGFALVTETRLVTLPPGAATLRFEGVASGIDPASALVRGVGVEEKNRDARLLSERGLLDRFTGQRVTVRRFDRARGGYREEPALLRSGANGVVLETAAGFEALRCTGLAQTLVFDRVPADLSAKPTLSVAVPDQPGGRYRVTLTYLADRFDWQANYVAEFDADGSAVALRGWMTLVSADDTSFAAADTNAVAGRVLRDGPEDDQRYAEGQRHGAYQCWPAGTTGAFRGYDTPRPPPPPPPPPPPAMMESPVPVSVVDDGDSIIVTGSRIARREDLGDLKLYRIPFPTDVAARSQKQVAFLEKPAVKGELFHRVTVSGDTVEAVERVFRFRNTAEAGLGEPLPSGQVAFFQRVAGTRQLVGEDTTGDKALGEEIELIVGEADNFTAEADHGEKGGKNWNEVVLTLRNANPVPVTVEAELESDSDSQELRRFSQRTFERDGKRVWRVTVPANGQAELRYREHDR